MSRRPPTAEQLESLRETFRKLPPSTPRDFKAAGARAGVTEAAARRAYTRGWRGLDPIEAQLAKERAHQQQSVEVLKAESIVRALEANAAHLQAEMLQLRPFVRRLRETLIVRLDELTDLDPASALAHLAKLAKVHKDVANVSHSAVELRRLIDGEATSIIGHKPMAAEPVDLDAAQAVVDQLARAVRRAQGHGPQQTGATEGTTDGDISVN